MTKKSCGLFLALKGVNWWMDFCYFPTEGYIYWACQRSETADLASFQHFATWWIRCSGWTGLWYEISRRTEGTWVHNIHLIDAFYEDLIKYLRGGQLRPWHRWWRVKPQSQIYLNPHPPTFCSSTKFPDYRLRPQQAYFKASIICWCIFDVWDHKNKTRVGRRIRISCALSFPGLS